MRSQGASFEGTEVSLSYVEVSGIFFNKCLSFSYYTARYLLDKPHSLSSLALNSFQAELKN